MGNEKNKVNKARRITSKILAWKILENEGKKAYMSTLTIGVQRKTLHLGGPLNSTPITTKKMQIKFSQIGQLFTSQKSRVSP